MDKIFQVKKIMEPTIKFYFEQCTCILIHVWEIGKKCCIPVPVFVYVTMAIFGHDR